MPKNKPSLISMYQMVVSPISTGLSCLVVALGRVGVSTPSIKFDPDILEH